MRASVGGCEWAWFGSSALVGDSGILRSYDAFFRLLGTFVVGNFELGSFWPSNRIVEVAFCT